MRSALLRRLPAGVAAAAGDCAGGRSAHDCFGGDTARGGTGSDCSSDFAPAPPKAERDAADATRTRSSQLGFCMERELLRLLLRGPTLRRSHANEARC